MDCRNKTWLNGHYIVDAEPLNGSVRRLSLLQHRLRYALSIISYREELILFMQKNGIADPTCLDGEVSG